MVVPQSLSLHLIETCPSRNGNGGPKPRPICKLGSLLRTWGFVSRELLHTVQHGKGRDRSGPVFGTSIAKQSTVIYKLAWERNTSPFDGGSCNGRHWAVAGGSSKAVPVKLLGKPLSR
jgi:hypothetical protein